MTQILLPKPASALRSWGPRSSRRRGDEDACDPPSVCMESRRLLTSITMYPVPNSDGIPQDIAEGPDGNLWFTVGPAGPIGMMNATTHVVTQFDLQANYQIASGLTTGPDGNLWFTNISMTWNGTTEVTNGADWDDQPLDRRHHRVPRDDH